MKKLMMIVVAMAFLAFGFSGASAGTDKPAGAAGTEMNQSIAKDAKDVSALIGKDVKDMQGEDLGEVKDFVRDQNGEISLAVISHGGFMGVGGKDVAVPYSALSFNEGEDHFVLNVSKDQLAGAPEIRGDENLNDRAFAEEVYRYFGERPYWTDEGMKEGTGTREYFGADEGSDTFGAEDDLDMDPGAGDDIGAERDDPVSENY